MRAFVGSTFVAFCLASALAACGKGSNDPTPDAPAGKRDAAGGGFCGDSVCATSEIGVCTVDCGGGNTCNNNGTCEAAEMNLTPACGDCPNNGSCNNNGTCEPGMGEDVTNCPADCTSGGNCNMNGTCEAGEDMATCVDCLGGGLMCTSNAQCTNAGECCVFGLVCAPGMLLGDTCIPQF
jgi:hypothetical protein